MSRLDLALLSHPGQERERNEDNGAILDLGGDGWLLVVCDGMGGHDDGHVASRTAVDTICEVVESRADDPEPFAVLHDAIRAAHVAVSRRGAGTNMGTTAVVARVQGDRVWYGWVGDSRLYHLRDGAVMEMSEDHTKVAMLVARGDISPAEARDHPDAGVLIQALGAGMHDVRPTVYTEPIVLQEGDALLLCSDGLHDLVMDEELAGEIRLDAEDSAQRLVDLANARGGHDNITVVVARRAPPAPRTRPSRATRPELDEPSAGPIVADPEPEEVWEEESEHEEGVQAGFPAAAVAGAFLGGLLLGFAMGWSLSSPAPQATPQGVATPAAATVTPPPSTPHPTPEVTPVPAPAVTPTAPAPTPEPPP